MRIEKIYSRKRIKLVKNKKVNKFKIFTFLLILFIFSLIVAFFYVSYPTLKSNSESAAFSKANNIMNKAVKEVMQNYTYNDFVNIEKDEDGNIIVIQTNVVDVNNAVSQIALKIQEGIDNAPLTTIYINYGSISGVEILKNFGPKFNVELESAGSINIDIQSEFENAGINQTIHRIYLNINTEIGILTPFGCFSNCMSSKILLVESVIVGEIPQNLFSNELLKNP